jgi:mRNA interferase RelE/StbE
MRHLEDMAALDKGIARRVKQAVQRFAQIGAGSVKRLQDIDPPEYRIRVGDYRVRFYQESETIHILRVRHRREAYR